VVLKNVTLGLPTPTSGFSPALPNYTDPGLSVRTVDGSVSLIGLGGATAPASAHFTGRLRVDISTNRSSAVNTEVIDGR